MTLTFYDVHEWLRSIKEHAVYSTEAINHARVRGGGVLMSCMAVVV